MIRTVLQGTYSRTKPGWTRVPWCIIKVMVAMFPNLAPGPGQLTLHWHCVALYSTGWFIVYRVNHDIQGESCGHLISWRHHTNDTYFRLSTPAQLPCTTPCLVCMHGGNREKLLNGPALYNPYMIDTLLYWYKSSDWINWITKLLVMFSQVKCTHQIVTCCR